MTWSDAYDDPIAYLREALELHVLEVSDIVQWADDQIIARENPAYELIELALMSDSNRYDTASQLLRVGTPSLSRAEVLPYVLAKAYERKRPSNTPCATKLTCTGLES